MYTIEIKHNRSGRIENRFLFNRFSDAYSSFIERCAERSYDHEVEGDVFTAGGWQFDYTITLITNN